MNMTDKIVGLLGGMGPEATIDIFSKIVKATQAKNDEDHLRIIIDNNPKMPSRQDAILKGTENPGPVMGETACNLEKAGADFIIICANTAHYFYKYVQKAVDIKVLHIIEETAIELQKLVPNIQNVGVLATSGAIKANVYQDCLNKMGIKVLEVPKVLQEQIQDSIFSFKYDGLNKYNIERMVEAVDYLVANGAEIIIMGCTEIPIILEGRTFSVPLLDPNEVIARVAVKYAKEGN
jgi:aspartate racemase